MFKIDKNDGTTLLITRGDIGNIKVKKRISEGVYEPFYKDDVVTFSVKSNFGESEPVLRKTIKVTEDTETVTFSFTKEDTTLGDLIAEPTKYQYDIAINDDLTILGYDDITGAKYLKLYPEGSSDK